MCKHTKGPWDVQNKGTLGTRSARHEVVEGTNVDGSVNLPTVVKMPNLSQKSYDRATLIAAAPDLLKALKNAADALDRWDGLDGWDDNDANALNNARAQIDRAEPKP